MRDKPPKLLNAPNLLSLSRIAAIPVLVLLLTFENRITSRLAAILFLIAIFTDLLDGFLARRQQVITNFGRFLDPVADKLINSAALIMLIPLGRIPAWMVLLIIARELAVTGLRAMASSEGIVIDASMLGKRKTLTQNTAIFLLIFHYPIKALDFHLYGMVLLWMALIITYWSGIAYFYNFFRTVSLSSGEET